MTHTSRAPPGSRDSTRLRCLPQRPLPTRAQVAALLGRRLLLHPVGSYLPSDHLLLGNRSWSVRGDAFARHLAQAHVVHEQQAAAALGLQRFPRSANRTAYRTLLLQYLEGFAHEPHLWLNVSQVGKGAHYTLAKETRCPGVGHGPAFLACVGRLMTTPTAALETHLETARRRLRRDPARPQAPYAALHARTFGADLGVPPDATPDPQLLLKFLAWEAQVNASAYTEAVLRFCSRMARNNMTVYVASDSRGAVAMFERLCPGQIEHLGTSYRRVHLKSRHIYKNQSQASAGLIDWVLLSEAKLVVRWGAQHSSFAKSAVLRGCGAKQGRSPKDWKWASAGVWLVNKIRGAIRRHRRDNESYNCGSPLAGMLRTTPCATPCITECIAKLESAYA